jgi:hypothetical protein
VSSLAKQRIQKWAGISVAFIAVGLLTASTDGQVRQFTGGEVLTLCGFLLTCAAILWRGGRLEGVLNRMERDIARLSESDRDVSAFRTQSVADRARITEQIVEMDRRMTTIENTCSAMHRKTGPGI